MIKVIPSGSFDFGIPVASLIDLHTRGIDRAWMIKRASVLTRELMDLRPKDGHAFIHLISLGAQEAYGANRNGDGFPEKRGTYELLNPKQGTPKIIQMADGLVNRHSTFTKFGHVFKHHQNDDPKKKIGDIYAEAYNPEMKRGELVIDVPMNDKAREEMGAIPHDWSSKVDKLASGKDIAFSMACVSDPDYPVLTSTGYKRIADIKIGDLVLTHTGKWQKVKSVNRRIYTGELVKFHVRGLSLPLEVTIDHPMWAKIFSGSRQLAAVKAKASRYFTNPKDFNNRPADWSHAEHINKGDRLFYQPVPRIPGYSEIADTRLAQLMGYYLAEGSFGYNGEKACTVQFSCHMDDELPRRLPKIMAELYPNITVQINPNHVSKVGLSVDVFNTHFAEFMWKYIGRGCKQKGICPEIFNASKEVKLSFMGAWMDGDGFVDKKGAHWSTSNLFLALQGRDLLASIGIPASIYCIDHAKCETSGMPGSGKEYTLNVSHLDAEHLTGWSEKAKEAISFSKDHRTKPASLRPCLDGRYAYQVKKTEKRLVQNYQTYNIEVEEDESYTLAGLISHNCKVAYDICSNCGNRSPNRRMYCEHLADHMSDLTKEGHQNFAINDVPDFFDISDVFRPADRIAWSLRKVAALSENYPPIGGAALAEAWGLDLPPGWLDLSSTEASFKRAAARKLADMEKQIDAVATGLNNSHINQLHHGAPCGNIQPKAMEVLKSVKLGEALQALGDAQILLGFDDFLTLVAETKMGSAAGDIGLVKKMLPGLYDRLVKSGEIEECVTDSAYDLLHTAVPRRVKDAVWELMKDHSFAPECVEKRAQVSVIRGRALALPTRAEKQAAVQAPSSLLAKEYAKYQLAFAKAAAGNQLVTGLTTLLNSTTV